MLSSTEKRMNKEALATGIVKALHKQGHQAFFAGGCVRDRLRGVEPKDFDIATSAKPEEVQRLFSKTVPVGAQFGVVLVLEESQPFEVATFRTEGGYQDGRRPGHVEFASVEEDAKRRDFTVNGLYYDVAKKEVLDFVGGREDLKKKLIRTIGNAEERFLEDHLRMMRAVRFAVQLEFEVDPEILKTIKTHAGLIRKVSAERIRDEFSKTLITSSPVRGVKMLDETGLLIQFLPEMEQMKGVQQPKQFHPEGDVWVHTLMLLERLKNPPLELSLGALLHDVAKPATFTDGPDRIRFNGHDTLGAQMTREIMRRLAYSNDQIELVSELVAQHLRFKDAFQMRTATLKRFFSLDRFDLHMQLHWLDCMASHKNLDAYEFCKQKLEEFSKEPPPPSRLIGGEELMALGHEPGPRFKEILRTVEDGILEGSIRTKEEAIRFVEKNYPIEKGKKKR